MRRTISFQGGWASVLLALAMTTCSAHPGSQEPSAPKAPQHLRVVKVGQGPDGLLLSRDGLRAFVANVEDTTISVLDLGEGRVSQTLAVGSGPWGMVHLGDSTRVLVSVWGDKKLVVLDEVTLGIQSSLPLPFQPTGVAASKDGSRVYVAGGDDLLHGFDLDSGTEFASIAVGKTPDGVALTNDGKAVWVANNSGSISVVQLGESCCGSSWSETRLETGGKPEQITNHPSLPLMFVSNFTQNKVSLYDTETNTLLRVLDGAKHHLRGPEELRFSKDGRRFFIAAFESNRVFCFGVEDLKTCGSWSVGSGTIGVEVLPGEQVLLTTNYKDNSVSLLRLRE